MNAGSIRRPNFFIVGAQKCGTTSLSQYLRDHPAIFLSTPKELFYFASDFTRLRRATSEHEYLRYFGNADPKALAIGEASTGYLFSSVAIRNIREFNENARIIVMLRNPVDLVSSLHSQMLFTFNEDETDFSRAWELQDERLSGRHLPRRCRTPQFLQYRNVGMLGKQVDELLTIFPREQIHIIFFEDFISQTRDTYESTLRFLQVPNDHRDFFPHLNPQKSHRFPRIFSLVSRRPPYVQRMIDRLRESLGPTKMEQLHKLYTKRPNRKSCPEGLRSELISTFRSDIELLSELTGRNLANWTANSSSTVDR